MSFSVIYAYAKLSFSYFTQLTIKDACVNENRIPVVQTCQNIAFPWNSRMYAEHKQNTWATCQRQMTPHSNLKLAPRRFWSTCICFLCSYCAQLDKSCRPEHKLIQPGRTIGMRQMYQTKYCAVQTRFKATNPTV